jgi:hypothetical protein
MSYADKLKSSLYWWLSKTRPFIVNDEYQIDLLFIDKDNNTAKIRVTNIRTNESQTLGMKEVGDARL